MTNTKEIGGFLELELNISLEYHDAAIRLNTGRNALEYILKTQDYSFVYLPYYTCEAIIEPLEKLDIKYEFYKLDENLTPVFDYKKLKENEAFLYTNYFGLKDDYVLEISKKCKNLIIDNSQAFYSKPLKGIDTFYSPRKFFGVSDGGYLYCSKEVSEVLNLDISYERMIHLVGRVDRGAEEFHRIYQENETKLKGQPIKKMSLLTQKLLKNVAYEKVSKYRRRNYKYLESSLNKRNKLNFTLDENAIPLSYPLLLEKGQFLKNKLIENKVFVPTYWPNVLEWVRENSFEYFLTQNLVSLPIDQRYSEKDMELIISLINDE